MLNRSQRLLSVFLPLACVFLTSTHAQSWWLKFSPGDTVEDIGYKPVQPIPFSHALHAGDKQIPCQYCHAAARRSTVAGIPPMNTCMGCHKIVATDRDPIKFLQKKYENNEPVEWVKVHDLPDYVRFSHKRHVLAQPKGGGLACQDCHGAVETMAVVEQVAPLQMGWCIECHREKGAPINCNACHF